MPSQADSYYRARASRMIRCPHCDGDGRAWREKVGMAKEACPQCGGEGKVLPDVERGRMGEFGLSSALRYGRERSERERGPITVYERRVEGKALKWWVRSVKEGRPESDARTIYVYESGHCIWDPVKQRESER